MTVTMSSGNAKSDEAAVVGAGQSTFTPDRVNGSDVAVMVSSMRCRRILRAFAVMLTLLPPPLAAQNVASSAAPLGTVATAFPDGAHFAYLDLDSVVALSTEGKALTARLQEFRNRKGTEVQARRKQVDDLQTRLASEVLNEATRAQLQREFDRAKVDFQRFAQDADEEFRQMQEQMQLSFGQKLFPVVGQVAKEKNLWAVFTATPLVVWHDPRIDITEEVARRIDAAPSTSVPPRR